MQRLGFIHDMLDVKVLILFVASNADYALTVQEIYELSYQDECLSYFDVCTAVPEMVRTGHLREVGNGRFTVTEKGREQGEITADSIAYTVKKKAMAAVEEYNRLRRKTSTVTTRVESSEGGALSVVMQLDNGTGKMMTLDLAVPNERQAERLAQIMQKKGEDLYHTIIAQLISEEDSAGN